MLKNGEISEMGQYKELIDSGGEFSDVISTYLEAQNGTDSDGKIESSKVIVSITKTKICIRNNYNILFILAINDPLIRSLVFTRKFVVAIHTIIQW